MVVKKTSTTDPIFITMNTNLQTYNTILKQNIRLANEIIIIAVLIIKIKILKVPRVQ